MSVRTHVDELNSMILQGQILDAFEKFYAEEVVMSDNGVDPREGKDVCRTYEEAFVGGLTAFRGAEIKNIAVNEETGVAMVEWFFDYTHKDWGDMAYSQVAVQEWKDGQIVKETFYHA
ncbi:MAG: nuclear transport factor 2 family protein [Rhodothermales bacterium]